MKRLLLAGLFLTLSACTGPWYQHRLCRDVGDELYASLTTCQREWFDWGLSLESAKTWCGQGMSLDIREVTKIIKSLEILKKTEDIREDERDMLNRALIPLKLFLLMQPKDES